MAEGLKPVGISLIAENADQFVTQTQAASKAEADLVATTKAAATATADLQVVTQAEYDGLIKAGVSVDFLAGTVRVETAEVKANTGAVAENNTAMAENTQTTTKAASAYQNNFTVMREGRLVMGVLIADMALMQLTAGQTNPQIQEMGKALQTVIDTGLLAFIATGNPVIAVAAGIAAGLLAVTQMATQADPSIVALNKDLDKFAAKDDAVQGLMKLTGATQDEATAALDFAKNHADAAEKMKGFEEQAQSSTPIAQGIADALAVMAQALGDIVKSIIPAAAGISSFTREIQINFDAGVAWFKVLHDTGDIQQANAAYSKFLADGLTQQEISARKLTQTMLDLAQAHEIEAQATLDAKNAASQAADLQKTVADDASKMLQLQVDDQAKLAKAARDTNTQIANDWRSLQDNLAQISFQRTQAEENNAQQILQINQAMDDAIAKAGQTLNDTLAKDAQALADKEANIRQQTNDKLASLYHDYQTKIETADDAIVKSHQTYADKITQIDKQQITDLANLDFTTKEQLDAAKTENDKEQVLERAAHEREVIRDRANTQKSAAEQALADSEQVAAKQKTDARAVYEYQRGLEQQHAAQQIADAQRAYAEQNAAAERAYAQQVVDAKNRDAQQLANLAFRMQQEEEALNRQVENARARYNQQVADLRARLAQEVADTIAAEIAKAQAIAAEIQMRMLNLGLIMQTAAAEAAQVNALSATAGANIGAMTGTYLPGMQGQTMAAAAEGMDAIVASPTMIQVGENYRAERVHIQPLSSNTSTTNNSRSVGPITVNIQSNDPEAVWAIFQKRLAQEIWR